MPLNIFLYLEEIGAPDKEEYDNNTKFKQAFEK